MHELTYTEVKERALDHVKDNSDHIAMCLYQAIAVIGKHPDYDYLSHEQIFEYISNGYCPRVAEKRDEIPNADSIPASFEFFQFGTGVETVWREQQRR